jgi:hypothetical protein
MDLEGYVSSPFPCKPIIPLYPPSLEPIFPRFPCSARHDQSPSHQAGLSLRPSGASLTVHLVPRANAERSDGGNSLSKALADDGMTGSSHLVHELAAIQTPEDFKVVCVYPGCYPSQAATAMGSGFVGSSSVGRSS